MQTVVWDLVQQFPVRRSEQQKSDFRKAVTEYAQSLGYSVSQEKGSAKSVNLVIGDPQTAKYLVTAHYDTCARMLMPNFMIPFNLPMFILAQLVTVGLLLLVAFAVGGAAWLLGATRRAAYLLGAGVYWVALYLMLFGPANPNNQNDNTSGVITLLELARSLPELHRRKVCYVLFDKEEYGLIGSKSYRLAHKQETEHQIVLNLDCVGDGDALVLIPIGKARKNASLIQALKAASGQYGQKSIAVHDKGIRIINSDQSQFPFGIAIAAFRKSKWIGHYVSRIHTIKDTILDVTNVNTLRAYLSTLIANDAAVIRKEQEK